MNRLTVLGLSLLLATVAPALAQTDGVIRADGSSTVYPITDEAARRFLRRTPGADIEVRFSGTTGGFRRFCAGETDISNASRPIDREELAACEANEVRFIELPIAFDALTVVVHPDNDWADFITVEELKRMWEPAAEGRITSWRQIRADWPDRPIQLFGRGQDSGTYDYFTTTIVGETRASRMDYTGSEDEELLAAGVMSDPDALAFFGVGAYFRHWEDLRDLGIDAGAGPVYPSLDAVRAGRYQPLARPLFLYVNAERLKANPRLGEFVTTYLGGLRDWVHFTGYMPLDAATYDRVLAHFQAGRTGTAFNGEIQVGVPIGVIFR